eukprot:07029.XXX_207332_207457_1 [CDS] Oithona nana genome sequencing.
MRNKKTLFWSKNVITYFPYSSHSSIQMIFAQRCKNFEHKRT